MASFGFFIVLVLAMWPTAGMSTTYYVAKTGNDGHSCMQAQAQTTAKLTVAAGLSCVTAGDTLYIKGGTYVEVIGRRQIPSGAPSAPTVVAGFPGEAITLRPATGGMGGDAVWFGDGYSYITLRNLIVDASNVTVQGVRFNEATHHITIEDTEIKNAPASNCIGVSGTNDYQVHHLTFRNVSLHHCGGTKLHHGIYLRGSDHLIEKSNIYNNQGYGVHVYSGPASSNTRTIVRNNRVHDNGARGILIGTGSDHVAYNNIVWGNGFLYGGGGMQIYSGTPHNNQIYNNTVYKNNGVCIEVTSDSTNAVVKNNICWQNVSDTVSNKGIGSIISHNLTVDPRLWNVAGLDFRLREGSPAIDAGTSIEIFRRDFYGTSRPQNSSYDVGAHEFIANAAPKAPVNLAAQ